MQLYSQKIKENINLIQIQLNIYIYLQRLNRMLLLEFLGVHKDFF